MDSLSFVLPFHFIYASFALEFLLLFEVVLWHSEDFSL